MPRIRSLILNFGSRATHWIQDFDLRLRLRDMWHQRFIFKKFWKIKDDKDWSDSQLDSVIQPKTRGATPYGARVLRAPYMIKISGLEHLPASEQPEELGRLLDVLVYEGPEATRRMFCLLEVIKDASTSTRCLQDSATKSSGACQTRGSGTAHRHRMF